MRRKSDFVARNVADQDLIVPVGPRLVDMNAVIVLNPTGRFVWDLLGKDRSVEDLTDAVAERFDVDIERARADVQAFLDDIKQMGLLET